MASFVETYRGYDIYRWEERQGHEKYYPVYCATPQGSAAVMGGNGVSGTFGSASACRTAIDRKIEPKVEPVYDPVKASGGSTKEFVECYRGVNIYQYQGTASNYTCKYGSSTSLSAVRYLIDKNLDEGAPPDLQKPTPDIYQDVKDAEETRTEKPIQVQVQPRVVDTYQGVDVVYHPDTDLYTAKVGEKQKSCSSMDAAHAFIDHEQYVNSNQFQIDQAKKKAEEEEELRKAFLSEEEARKEEEAREEETQGGWFSIFLFKLKSEIRRTLEMLK